MLLGIEHSWESGRAVFRIEVTAEHSTTIVAVGTQELSIAQQNPWGQSVYVDEVAVRPFLKNRKELVIQMQSGDLIRCVAETIEVRT